MKTLFILFAVLFFSLSLSAQSKKVGDTDTLSHNSSIDAVSDTIPNLTIFGDETPIDLRLEYDITSFIKNKMKGEYLDAQLKIEYKGYENTKNIRLKARGNNRRKTCFFPPIYLNFKTDPIENSELVGFKKVKLVTHCSTSKSYTDYLMREFLVYKLYNVISDNSFRIKLLNIDYVDTGKKERSYKRHGLLIEPIELIVKRREAIEIDGTVLRSHNVIEEDVDIVAFFQYMIGNTDWRIKGGHNTKFIKPLTSTVQKAIPVPYDFDFAGFVGTHYSHPQTWTSIETVKEREYMGYCRSNDGAYLKTINFYLSKKSEIMQTIESFTYLPERDRKDLIKYIESFYDLLDNPKYFLSILKGECRSSDF